MCLPFNSVPFLPVKQFQAQEKDRLFSSPGSPCASTTPSRTSEASTCMMKFFMKSGLCNTGEWQTWFFRVWYAHILLNDFFSGFFCQFREWNCHCGEIGNKSPVPTNQFYKGLYFLFSQGLGNHFYGLNLFYLWPNFPATNQISKVFYILLSPRILVYIQGQTSFLNLAPDSFQMLQVLPRQKKKLLSSR